MPETTQLNVRVSRVLAERIARVISTTGVGRAEWVRARLVEAVDDAERRMLDLTAEHESAGEMSGFASPRGGAGSKETTGKGFVSPVGRPADNAASPRTPREAADFRGITSQSPACDARQTQR